MLTFGTYYSFALQVTQLCNCKYPSHLLPSTSPFVTGEKNKTSNLARPGVFDTIHGQRRTRKSPIQSLLHLGQVSSPPKPPPQNQSQSHLHKAKKLTQKHPVSASSASHSSGSSSTKPKVSPSNKSTSSTAESTKPGSARNSAPKSVFWKSMRCRNRGEM